MNGCVSITSLVLSIKGIPSMDLEQKPGQTIVGSVELLDDG